MSMNLDYLLLTIAGVVFLYLLYALINPEKF